MGSKPKNMSASRGAAVLGLNEWQSQWEIWQIMKEELYPGFNKSKGYELPPPVDNASIRWGLAFEDSVIKLTELETDEKIIDQERLYEKGNCTCHIDGMYLGSNTASRIHEGKTTSEFPYRKKWGEPGTSRVPGVYQVQTQHQMYCTGADLDIVSVLVFPKAPAEWEKEGIEVKNNPAGGWFLHTAENIISLNDWASVLHQMGYFHQYPVPRDDNAIKSMLEGYEDFWNRYIIGGEEPIIDRYDDIRRAFPEPVGTIICDPDFESMISEYGSIRNELGKSGPLSKRQTQLKTMILEKARFLDPVIDDESRDKTIFMSTEGKKLASFNGKVFR